MFVVGNSRGGAFVDVVGGLCFATACAGVVLLFIGGALAAVGLLFAGPSWAVVFALYVICAVFTSTIPFSPVIVLQSTLSGKNSLHHRSGVPVQAYHTIAKFIYRSCVFRRANPCRGLLLLVGVHTKQSRFLA